MNFQFQYLGYTTYGPRTSMIILEVIWQIPAYYNFISTYIILEADNDIGL